MLFTFMSVVSGVCVTTEAVSGPPPYIAVTPKFTSGAQRAGVNRSGEQQTFTGLLGLHVWSMN